MAKTATARSAQPWEAKWAFIPSMNQHRDNRVHLCVAVKVTADIVT